MKRLVKNVRRKEETLIRLYLQEAGGGCKNTFSCPGAGDNCTNEMKCS